MEEEKKEEVKKEVKEEAKKEVKKQEVLKDEKKKFGKTKGDTKKSNIGIIVGIIIIALILVAIAVYIFLVKDSPRQIVENMLKDLKAGNYSQGILASMLEEEEFDEEAQKLLFDKLDWKILNVNEDGDKAIVELEITNKDFKTIIGNYMQKIIKVAFGGENPSEEQMTNYLIEELNNSGVQNVTSNQFIILEKKDGKWKISEENNFVNIFLPGFEEAINSFN